MGCRSKSTLKLEGMAKGGWSMGRVRLDIVEEGWKFEREGKEV